MAWAPTRTPAPTAAQRGAAAVEFALVFPLFLLLFLGMVFFGVTFTLQHTLTHAAQVGARAGLAVNPDHYLNDSNGYKSQVETLVKDEVKRALDWMPEAMFSSLDVKAPVDDDDDIYWVNVTIKLSHQAHPLAVLATALELLSFNSIDVSTDLTGQATLRL